jgi:hypothetical protein
MTRTLKPAIRGYPMKQINTGAKKMIERKPNLFGSNTF